MHLVPTWSSLISVSYESTIVSVIDWIGKSRDLTKSWKKFPFLEVKVCWTLTAELGSPENEVKKSAHIQSWKYEVLDRASKP